MGGVSVVSIDNVYCIKFSKGINEIEKEKGLELMIILQRNCLEIGVLLMGVG